MGGWRRKQRVTCGTELRQASACSACPILPLELPLDPCKTSLPYAYASRESYCICFSSSGLVRVSCCVLAAPSPCGLPGDASQDVHVSSSIGGCRWKCTSYLGTTLS